MGSTSTLLIAPSIYKNAGYHAGSFAPVARVADSTEVLAVHPSVPRRLRGRIGRRGEVPAGCAELRLGRARNASPYRRRAPEGARPDRYEPRSLSRRRSGPDGPARRAGPGSLLHADPNAPEYPGGPCAGTGCYQRSPQQAGADLPTMVESGFDQFVVTSITAIVAPPGTPIDIRRRLNQAVAGARASPGSRAGTIDNGWRGATGLAAEELAAFLATE